MARWDSFLNTLKRQVQEEKKFFTTDEFAYVWAEYALCGKLPEHEGLREEVLKWKDTVHAMIDTMPQSSHSSTFCESSEQSELCSPNVEPQSDADVACVIPQENPFPDKHRDEANTSAIPPHKPKETNNENTVK